MGALDWFRIAAALFVVAIHTSPLKNISVWGDLTLTRIVGRVAVPFFFMVTGYFVLGREEGRQARIHRALVKNLRWYLLAILLYLPINWYAGRLTGLDLSVILRELLIQGTFYHLWYLPALITGLILSWLFIGMLGMKSAVAVSALLYVIGLFGDSYYGLAAGLPTVKSIYEGIFRVMENTRNGLFLAPLFLTLGAAFRKKDGERKKCEDEQRDFLIWGIGLAVSLSLMTVEGLFVHRAGLPHHDSMYACLPVVMIFLFGTLLRFPMKENPGFRRISLWIYLLHPAVIVVIRAFAGITGTDRVLVENNLIHFVCVAFLSAVTAYLLTVVTESIESGRTGTLIRTARKEESR